MDIEEKWSELIQSWVYVTNSHWLSYSGMRKFGNPL